MRPDLPPGPRAPAALQSLGWWTRPVAYLERARARHGRRFTIRLLGAPPFVMVSDPDEIKAVFTAPPDVLHPGEGAQILEPIVGSNSVILLDEDPHLSQRKLMLPAFHGERMQALDGLVTEVSEEEVARWPEDEEIELHPRLQDLTLEIILRAVFGLDPGPRLDAIRTRLSELLAFGENPASLIPQVQLLTSRFGPVKRFLELREQIDELLYELIDERRAETGEDRSDILSMLLEARHDDGTPMSREEVRDELMTLLVAGHETTASSLAWTFERLTREPAVLRRLTEEVESGEGDDYLVATIQETLRRRPVLPNSAPRLVKKPVTIGGFDYPVGVCLVPNAYLVQHDPEIYEEPYAFRPERFLDEGPGTYTWIPFGGGRRRCLGASFAQLEMKIVMRAVVRRGEVSAVGDDREPARRRAITISPSRGARLRIRSRRPAQAPVAA